jgi:Tol biopolymer transport system component/DNA-binding winged helix-turn-helix (wHTH) protein
MTDSDVVDVVEISGFRFDFGRRRLTDPEGMAVPLSSKAFDTLAYLVANPGRVVDKHELLDAVWPGVAVEENTLNHAISALRRALGDCRTQPRFIATIQGRGYQLIAAIRHLDSQTEGRWVPDLHAGSMAGLPAGASSMLGRLRGRRSLLVGMAGGIPAAAVFYLAGFTRNGFLNRSEPVEFAVGARSKLSLESMLEFDAALSPDGRLVAYAAGPIGRSEIYVRPVAGGNPTVLTEDLPGSHTWPRWSPDGNRIAFNTWSLRSHDTLHLIAASGGLAEPLVRAPALTGHAWSPDGARLVYTRSRESSGLYLYSIENGERVRIDVDAYDPHSPSWSPNGAYIAYASGNSPFAFGVEGFANIAPSAIWIAAPDGSDVRQVTTNEHLNVSPDWASDSRSLFIVSDRHGTRDIYQVALPERGREPLQPGSLTQGLNAHSLSRGPAGDRLIYSELVSSANIWRVPVPADGMEAPHTAEAVTTGNQTIESMDISSDGAWIVFDSNRSGNQDIYKGSLTDDLPIRHPTRLTEDDRDDFLPCVSPDAAEIAFHSFRNGNRDIYLMSADGEQERPVTSEASQQRYPDWSPDGNRIVFMADVEDSQQAFIVSRQTDGAGWGAPEQVTFHGGWYPKWSPDGSLIACTTAVSGMNSSLEVVSADSFDRFHAVDLGPEGSASYPVWASNSRTVYLNSMNSEGVFVIWSVPLFGGERKPLVSLKNLSPSGPSRMEFATDGTYFYFTLAERSSDIWTLALVEETGSD